MEKYINEFGKVCYRGVTEDTAFTGNEFHMPKDLGNEDTCWAFHTNLGSLTVLDRMTGYGFRDIETGFRDMDGYFWLASGNCDVRHSGCATVGEAIQWVKDNANTCVNVPPFKKSDN